MTLTIELNVPEDLEKFTLPHAVAKRLQDLLDLQDSGVSLTEQERAEAEGLVDIAEFLTLLRLRSQRESN